MFFLKLNGKVSVELIKYAIFGSLGVAIDVGVLLILKEVLGFYYLTAATIAFLFGLTASYIFSIKFIFKGYLRLTLAWETIIFFAIGAMGVLYNYQIIKFLTQNWEFGYLTAKGIAIVVVVAWNFFGKKILLFNKIKSH